MARELHVNTLRNEFAGMAASWQASDGSGSRRGRHATSTGLQGS